MEQLSFDLEKEVEKKSDVYFNALGEPLPWEESTIELPQTLTTIRSSCAPRL